MLGCKLVVDVAVALLTRASHVRPYLDLFPPLVHEFYVPEGLLVCCLFEGRPCPATLSIMNMSLFLLIRYIHVQPEAQLTGVEG